MSDKDMRLFMKWTASKCEECNTIFHGIRTWGERKGDLQSYFPVKLFSLSSWSWLGFMNFNERQYMRENCLKIQPLLAVAFNCAKKDDTFSDRTAIT